jgi:autotransporter-associated beta strand protein
VIAFTGANNFTFANNVSGLGSLNQSGTGVLTISGDNSYSGGTLINSSRLVVGSSTGLGAGTVSSSGGTLSTVSGITLPSLTVNGPVTVASNIATTGNQTYSSSVTFAGNVNSSGNLTVNGAATVGGNITTAGNQTYYGAVTLSGSGSWTHALWDLLNPTVTLTNARPSNGIGNTLTSSGANITFNGTLLASNQQSLSINATSGIVTFGNSVGNSSQINGGSQNPLYATYDKSRNMNNLFINASRILIKANIATVGDQILKGTILVGDNGQNGLTRTLLSADPSIQLIGTVDDAADSTHNLILYVISAPGGATPTLNIGGPVGSLMPLASLDWVVGRQNTTSYLADISGTTPVGSITNPNTIITVETIKADAVIAAAKAAAAARAANSSNTLAVQTFMQQAISYMSSYLPSRPSGVSVSTPQDVAVVQSSSSSSAAGAPTSESKSTSSQASVNASTTLAPPSISAEPSSASPARQILVQVQTAQGIELMPRSQVSSDSGLNFKVPTGVLTSLQISPAAIDTRDAKAPVLFATLADGTALPSWIQFDPQTQTFKATQIPSDVKSVTIKLQSKQGQEVIGESSLTISSN